MTSSPQTSYGIGIVACLGAANSIRRGWTLVGRLGAGYCELILQTSQVEVSVRRRRVPSAVIQVTFLTPVLRATCSAGRSSQGYLNSDCALRPWPGCLLIPVFRPWALTPGWRWWHGLIPAGAIVVHFLPGKQQLHCNLSEAAASILLVHMTGQSGQGDCTSLDL